ncbi:zinc dependent phospholipase C family protein [Paenibacillus sp. HN-1]|uniref:zinc dependent phospholipase C family protein n=1 Tax=Paenibacillus TaxID=44249 RepID=UPI001CA939FA|nr:MULTISPECIES: zinc dependent phospholipase C family protein [Paenibacillus]MBY9081968.1 zinc dependent phospholipase C family protein [Paenibacillus sp. CGMCC 1.18879]MBY9085874.1 zinc dependent phospholipase C family protein [Paenibacillus sinensis]
MPNLWMHIEYGRQLERDLQGSRLFPASLQRWRQLYQLGCQGPDLLYYYGFLPWKKDIQAGLLGDLFHGSDCGPVLMEFWDRVLELPDAQREQASAYFAGFVTHHLLDRNLHPYINWKAGYKYRDHQRFEILLDTVFLAWLNGGRTWELAGWKQIDAGPELPASIVSILHDTATSHYTEAAAFPQSGWQEAYRDVVLAQRLLFDPHGWKKKIVRGTNAGLFYRKPNPAETKLDVLNERKAPWRHSALYSEVRTESVPELWELALAEGRAVLGALSGWLSAHNPAEANNRREHFRSLLGNRSYDTGKDCASNLINQYAEPIWESAASS